MPNDRAFMAISHQAPCTVVLSGSLRVICLYSDTRWIQVVEHPIALYEQGYKASSTAISGTYTDTRLQGSTRCCRLIIMKHRVWRDICRLYLSSMA